MSVQPGYGVAIYVPVMAERSVFIISLLKFSFPSPLKQLLKRREGGATRTFSGLKRVARKHAYVWRQEGQKRGTWVGSFKEESVCPQPWLVAWELKPCLGPWLIKEKGPNPGSCHFVSTSRAER